MNIESKLKLPKNRIAFFKNGKVEGIQYFYSNDGKIDYAIYRMWGHSVLNSKFYRILGNEKDKISEKEVKFRRLPSNVRFLFLEKDRKNIVLQKNVYGHFKGYIFTKHFKFY